jgi:transcriptional regulator with XRE-family HTH domain
MGKASQALRWVLEQYGISQNKLAVAMGISRANVGRWFHGLDPSAENIAEITKALKQIDPNAAREFVQRYLGEILEDDGESDRATDTE